MKDAATVDPSSCFHVWVGINRCSRCAKAHMTWCGGAPWVYHLHFDNDQKKRWERWLGPRWFEAITRGPHYRPNPIFPIPPKPRFVTRNNRWVRV